jgi:Fe-S-cluster containining protein
MTESNPLDNYDLDEDGDHDDDECQKCLEANHTITNSCRCGECCEQLIIEVSARDAIREPLIKVLGQKLRDDVTGEYPPDDEADWLLNRKEGGGCVFFDRDVEGQGVCGIHATRPLVCRLFCCDEDMPRIRESVGGPD